MLLFPFGDNIGGGRANVNPCFPSVARRFMLARDRIANTILAETDQSQAALQKIYSL